MSSALNFNSAGFPVNGLIAAIRSIYHIAGDINAFIDEHIEKMKRSDNITVSRTGRVLEGAKYGFGIGYTVPITIIALGQLLLGFTVNAMTTIGSAAILSNPIAMTCAAIGAVYYGWNALTEQEKLETIESLRKELDVGVELIKSIVQFVISQTNELLSSENLKDLKEFISQAAQTFGKTLSEVTGAVKDKITDAYAVAKSVAGDTGEFVMVHAENAFEKAVSVTSDVGEVVSKGAVATKDLVVNAIDKAKNVSKNASK